MDFPRYYLVEIGWSVARLILPVVSFGKVQVAPLDSRGERFGWLGCRRSDGGRLEIESPLAAGIGLFACCIGLAIVLHFVS